MSQRVMAGLAGISRQSYGAIESGRSVPSTEVALRLARGLGLGVEELFSLSDAPSEDVSVEMIGPTRFISGPVRLFQIGGRLLGTSLQGSQASTPQLADGIGIASPVGGARVQPFKDRPPRPDLVAMGCDPAFELVARSLRRQAEADPLAGSDVPVGSHLHPHVGLGRFGPDGHVEQQLTAQMLDQLDSSGDRARLLDSDLCELDVLRTDAEESLRASLGDGRFQLKLEAYDEHAATGATRLEHAWDKVHRRRADETRDERVGGALVEFHRARHLL